jgi:hypothetical protein
VTDTALISFLRTLLHDTGAGFSTSNPFFSNTELIDSLTSARDELVRLLAASPKPPYVALMKITKTCPATENTNVPSDFWRIICGYMTDGSYVPAQSLRVGEAMTGTAAEQIYAKNGKFYGTAEFALYWAMPSQAITLGSVELTEFSDQFYHAVKYQAALNLLMKEDADARDRFASVSQELQRKLLALS